MVHSDVPICLCIMFVHFPITDKVYIERTVECSLIFQNFSVDSAEPADTDK